MSSLTVEMYPAENGDCFLITVGERKTRHILIDTGYRKTFEQFLKKRLLEISKSGGALELLVITHIDSDHIGGAIRLLEENGSSHSPKIIKIKEIWHNSYKHIQFHKRFSCKTDNAEKEILKSIIEKGFPDGFEYKKNGFSPVSARQGSSLASLILEGEYNWNSTFSGKVIVADNIPEVALNSDIKLILISPNNDNLKKLEEYWICELNKKRYGFKLTDDKIFDDAFEFFLLQKEKERGKINEIKDISAKRPDLIDLLHEPFKEDESPTNGSSISFVIEYRGKRLLFLGDAYASTLTKNLRKILNEGKPPLFFNAIKVSHHGSKANTSSELLNLIDSNVFMISANGKGRHRHPDLTSLARIVTRKKMSGRRLIFNYPTVEALYIKDKRLMEFHKYSIEISEGDIKKIYL